ncbi:OprM [Pseudomonas sp. PIC25]|uniref:efflux transporter outer membrane subunit n=1 Tax=Pseudomonas sp. PIC25 TaxID=1958773 RepID=UPI000BD8E851|nr:efflux transporter outer membrane subunit [Pseudomonas sp. PIC25]PAU60590.1 OprM [Pseudomonas sp. PIC25]
MVLSGCALQPDYNASEPSAPAAWSVASVADESSAPAMTEAWWRTLGDPAIDTLTEAAFADSPTLAQAVARIDEARATLGVNAAARMPTVSVSANLTRAQSQNSSAQTSSPTMLSTSASAGPSLSWELDLFGRVRNSVEAAQSRLDARTADAAATRLSLAADVANGVLSLRACENSRRVFVEDIASREKTLALTRLRLKTGFAAPVDEARALSGIASSRTSLASQEEQCTRQVNALVALSGRDASSVRQLVGAAGPTPSAEPVHMPQAPGAAPELPATVLAHHPDVVSADREAAAAWADIAVARANRLPRLDLAAALTGQWIRAAGSTLDFTTWSLGPSLTGTLFDGGAGAANVSAAEARYRLAVASLQGTLRSTVQEVENALAAQASAKARVVSAGEDVTAARTTFEASESQWRAGSISLFELEDSRRQFASAQDAEISARRDQAQAWITLVEATGGAITLTPESSHE